MSYLLLGVPLFFLFWNLYWLVVRPERKRRRAAAVEPRLPEGFVPPSAALVPPEPKAPRDVSRPYPRPARSRSKLNRICPVCGMEDPGNLDGKVLGWPAHHSCAEWLGDWRPSRQVPVPDAAMLGATWSAAGDRQPFQAFGDGLYHPLSAMAVGNHRPLSTTKQRQKPPGVPALFCDCPCGRRYVGTNEWLNRELALHRGSGECPAFP